jgi:hypothetical protein
MRTESICGVCWPMHEFTGGLLASDRVSIYAFVLAILTLSHNILNCKLSHFSGVNLSVVDLKPLGSPHSFITVNVSL